MCSGAGPSLSTEAGNKCSCQVNSERFSSPWVKVSNSLTVTEIVPLPFPLNRVLCFSHVGNRWFVFDTETKDLVTVHTDGNEQLSVMRYSPGQRPLPGSSVQMPLQRVSHAVRDAHCARVVSNSLLWKFISKQNWAESIMIPVYLSAAAVLRTLSQDSQPASFIFFIRLLWPP